MSWTLKRIKDVAYINISSLSNNTDPNYTFKYVDIGNVSQNGIIQEPELVSFKDSPSRARRIIRKDDVIVSTVRTYLKAVAYFEEDIKNTIVSTGFAVLTSKPSIVSKYLAYKILSDTFIDKIIINSTGVSYPAINSSQINDLEIELPPIKEQTQIANYLDAKTTAIDNKINLLESKIVHYKEYRKTLINETVTKGLDQTVKLKDSGIDWIGEIPEHWEIKRNKDLFIERGEKANNKIYDLLSVSEYYGVARREEKIKEDEVLVRADSLQDYKVCKIDDLVINIMLAWKKGLGVSRYNGIVSPAYGVFKRKIELFPMYYHYLFRTDLYTAEFKRNSRGIIESRLRLYPDRFYNVSSIFPPFQEQLKISKFLDNKSNIITKVINNLETQIITLKELRKTLINEVVTGKVKVTA